MTVLMGYADRISVAAGETIAFKVSCSGAARYRAEIVRVLSPEAGPQAPPFRREIVETPANGEYLAREQALRCGSWAMVPTHPRLAALESFSLQAFIWPTLPGRGRQAIAGTWSETLDSGFGLMIGAGGTLELRIGDGKAAAFVLASEIPLLTRKWYFVAASYDRASGVVRLYQELLADKTMVHRAPVEKRAAMTGSFKSAASPFLIAAWYDGEDRGLPRVGGHFNGKIDRPIVADRALTRAEMALLAGDAVPSGLENAVVARWDFSRDMSSEIIRDVSPNRLDGFTVNLPARAMTGHNWDGSEMNWRNAPRQYGAIHFHEDDIADARWETDFTFTVPEDLRSGCYAAWLTAAEARFQIAFFVRPAKGKAKTDIVYLASTATYTVYQNNIGR
ncbi:MAG TPA: LamG domain-containing protein, partial [Stellaceae bacterium]|nr:LamG domain-containing protein [Stellaceae bacterium]